jgi:hypothetical protein
MKNMTRTQRFQSDSLAVALEKYEDPNMFRVDTIMNVIDAYFDLRKITGINRLTIINSHSIIVTKYDSYNLNDVFDSIKDVLKKAG